MFFDAEAGQEDLYPQPALKECRSQPKPQTRWYDKQ